MKFVILFFMIEQQDDNQQILEEQFNLHAQIWRKETGHFSDLNKIVEHQSYQEIIRMGKAAIPMILAELGKGPDHWFYALYTITGEDAGQSAQTMEEARMGKKKRIFISNQSQPTA